MIKALIGFVIALKHRYLIARSDFIAIDFETATQKRSSACAVAMVFVCKENIIGQFRSLIKPPNNEFSHINVGIHGINQSDTARAPTIKQIWRKCLADVIYSEKPIVAHNASFDMSVLRESLNHHDIDIPFIKAVCTVDIAREMFPGLPDHKLPTVAQHMGISLAHHDPLSDATAAAKIMMAWVKETKLREEAEKKKAREISDRHAVIERALTEARALEKENPKSAAQLYVTAYNLIKYEHEMMREDHCYPAPPRMPVNRLSMVLEKSKAYQQCLNAIESYNKYQDPVGLTVSDSEAIQKRYSRVTTKLSSQDR